MWEKLPEEFKGVDLNFFNGDRIRKCQAYALKNIVLDAHLNNI